MRAVTRWLLGAGAVGILGWASCWAGPAVLCSDTITGRYPAPQGRRVAVLVVRDCGATTGYATHVFVTYPGEPLRGRRGNVIVADTDRGSAPHSAGGGLPIQVEWTGPDSLVLRYDARGRVFEAASRARGVQITHVRIAAGGA